MSVSVVRTRSARIHHGNQQVHYLYQRFRFNDIPQDVAAPARFSLGVLPAHALPLETYVRINSSFTGANLIVGTSANGSSAAVVSTGDVAAGTTGLTVVDTYLGTYSTVDVPLFIQTATTGETVGQADIWQAYLPAYPAT
jgi:hypothetical protein